MITRATPGRSLVFYRDVRDQIWVSIPAGGSVSAEAANVIFWWHPASWLDGMSTKGEAPNLTERAAATKNAIVLQSQRRSTHKFHIYAMFFAPALLLLIYIINMSFKKRPPAFYFLKHGFSEESICQWFPRIVHILRPSGHKIKHFLRQGIQ